MADKYLETDKMSDLISDDFRLLQVISRFGLSLGFGEKTVREVCDAQQVDCPTFLAIVNFTKYGEKVSDAWIDKVSVKSLTEYLNQTHSYFLGFLLPNIRRKLLDALDCSARNDISYLIIKFFDEYVSEIQRHMNDEGAKVFSYVDRLLQGQVDKQIPVEMALLHQEPVEKRLHELKNIIIKYCNVSSNNNLLNAALYDIFLCEEDLSTHYSMEEFLFLPLIHALEGQKLDQENLIQEEEKENSSTDVLSEREKEIIVSVVKGLTNKEIADQLYISINTVTTHRRNIARKLDIHSPAGLTIYAIVNKLVDISEVKDIG